MTIQDSCQSIPKQITVLVIQDLSVIICTYTSTVYAETKCNEICY